MANTPHLVKTSKLKSLPIPSFKFNLAYGKELVASKMDILVDRCSVAVNDFGCYLVGYFKNINEFTFGKYDPEAQVGKNYKGGYVEDPTMIVKPTDLICLQIENNDKFSDYSSFLGLFKAIPRVFPEKKLADSTIALSAEMYALLVPGSDGTEPDERFVQGIFAQGLRMGRLILNPNPETLGGLDFSEIDKIKISDSLGGDTFKGGSKTPPSETLKERVLSRLDILDDRELEGRLYRSYLKYRTLTMEDSEIYTGDFHFISFLEMMLK